MPKLRLSVFSKVGVQPDSRTLKSTVELCFDRLDQNHGCEGRRGRRQQ